MKYKRLEHSYLIKLEKGDEIISSLEDFCKKEQVKGGFFTGIGAVDYAKLGYYDLTAGKYLEREFKKTNFEVLSLQGNIVGDIIHAHIVLGNSEYRTIGGHLLEAIISVTGEVYLTPESEVKRSIDDNFNLNLLDL